MAGNTFKNLQHLGFDVELLPECQRSSIKKVRYVDENSNYIILRVDSGEDDIEMIHVDRLKTIELEQYDAVVVSDYNKGLLDDGRFLDKLFAKCDDLEIPTFMDTKKEAGNWSHYCKFIKINEVEYNASSEAVMNKFHKERLIVTLGGGGARYMDKIYETKEVAVRDVVGAGDTFLAGLVYGYLTTKDMGHSIRLANIFSADVVSKRGVALPDLKLIKEYYRGM